jgi:hypothetical protein
MKLTKRLLTFLSFNLILVVFCSSQIITICLHYFSFPITVKIESFFDSDRIPIPSISFCFFQTIQVYNKSIEEIRAHYNIDDFLKECCISSVGATDEEYCGFNCKSEVLSNADQFINSQYYCFTIKFQNYGKDIFNIRIF